MKKMFMLISFAKSCPENAVKVIKAPGIWILEKNEIFRSIDNGVQTVIFNISFETTLDTRKAGKIMAEFTRAHVKAEKIFVDIAEVDKLELAFGALLGSYDAGMLKTKTKKDSILKEIVFLTENPEEAGKQFEEKRILAQAVALARDLTNEPANTLYPENFAERVKDALSPLGVKVTIISEKELYKKGFNGVIAVGQGSVRPPCVAVMEWPGDGSSKKPIALVGKGVTFDSGGISIKPSQNMEDMKGDMAGAAVVFASMLNIAMRKSPVHAVGIIGLAENMLSGNSTKPGDVITSLSGQTIEIINTDAEGRIVLADVLWFAQTEYDPAYTIDFATLTGAIKVALGTACAGVFSDDEGLVSMIDIASKESGEVVCRLPLINEYDDSMKSPIADIMNISSGGVGAGSITAALFLRKFINGKPWAHIDIAGVSGGAAKGASGFGVMLTDRLVRNYEKK